MMTAETTASRHGQSLPIEAIRTKAYRIPTEEPESDGTLAWDSTTLVLAEVDAGGFSGLGYTYAAAPAAEVIAGPLSKVLHGRDAWATSDCWLAMVRSIRNQGRPGLASMAIAAVDCALWDLKARALGLPLAQLLGAARPAVEVYGSGGFTAYSDDRLCEQLSHWASEGMTSVKMKVGREPQRDLDRVEAAKNAVGQGVALMIDANGAYARKQALAFAEEAAALGVTWFEEPVSSDDLEGLRLLRDRAPAPMEIAAGEYGFDLGYFRHMLEAGAIDVLQADATRCAGVTGFMAADALCQAFDVPLSAHCAPALHCHLCCAAKSARNIEWFHDHVRIEQMLFDGAPAARDGRVAPASDRPGLGLALKTVEAEKYRLESR